MQNEAVTSQIDRLQIPLPDKAFIGGAWVSVRSGKTLPCIFPGAGETIGTVADCDAAVVDDAVKSARAAFEAGTWSRMAPQDRRRIMLRFSELILENRDDLALLETLNVGKPLVNATNGDIPSAAGCVAWFGEAIDKIYGEVGPTDDSMLAIAVREPVGVVGAVVPWNFPLSMPRGNSHRRSPPATRSPSNRPSNPPTPRCALPNWPSKRAFPRASSTSSPDTVKPQGRRLAATWMSIAWL